MPPRRHTTPPAYSQRRHTVGGFWAESHWVAQCARCQSFGDFYPDPKENDRAGGEREARRQGWSRKVDGWVCPNCQTAPRREEREQWQQ